MAWSQHKSRLGFSIRGHSVNNNDRRAAPRRGYNDDAWIGVEGSVLRRCRVFDLSRTGVRLTITKADRIPDTFILILSKNTTGFPALVKWQRHAQIGAEFSFAADLPWLILAHIKAPS